MNDHWGTHLYVQLDGRYRRSRLHRWDPARTMARLGHHMYRGLPPLPAGRRLRAAEHIGRYLDWRASRRALDVVLRLRFRALLPLMSVQPVHVSRICGPGCQFCAAIFLWRRVAEMAAGLPRGTMF